MYLIKNRLSIDPKVTPSICVVITGKTMDDFLRQLKRAQDVADFIELRLDYIDHITPNDLKTIRYYTTKKSIICCRSISAGGNFSGTIAQQHEILQTGNDIGFDYIDIDLSIGHHIQLDNKKSKIIMSYHNFDKTPALSTLEEIAKQMHGFSPDVLKFSAKTNNFNEVKTLFQFLLNKKENENRIVIGMGDCGKITRLLGPLLGGYLTFASLDNAGSAPGQIDIHTMKKMYQEIL